MSDENTPSTSWGAVAQWYDQLLGKDDTFQANVILPNLMRLLEVRRGERILDLACGQGFFSYALASCGAHVTGTDISPELIALAKQHTPTVGRKQGEAPKKMSVQFAVASANQQTPVATASMDRALIVLAIQNIEDVKGTFWEVHRALKPDGTLHVVLNHPAFRVPKGSSWEWDKNGMQYRRVDKYLLETRVKIQMKPGDDPGLTTVSFHRPLQFYVKTLVNSGFVITNLEEWTSHKTSDSGPRAAEENRARNEIPMFLYLEARRTR